MQIDGYEVFIKEDNESVQAYIDRVCAEREDNNLTWEQLAQIINVQCGLNYSEGYYRKNWKKKTLAISEKTKAEEHTEEVDRTEKLKEVLKEIKLQKVKLSDERIQVNADYRRLSREDTIKEIAHDYAVQMSDKKVLPPIPDIDDVQFCDNSAILQLSDWHYGMLCDNPWNMYDPDICVRRVGELRDRVIEKCRQNGVKGIYVANLSDMIAGRIHLPIRLRSRFDVITQTMNVAEILAEFLYDLAGSGLSVHYYDCFDNHSRLEPNKKESLDLESLSRIIHWYLKERVGGFCKINENKYGDDIITFDCRGFKVVGVHGHKDKPSSVIDDLSMMTHETFDLALLAHYHHFQADEKNECLMLSNGSLMGTDDYAVDLRLTSKPSQNLIIVSDTNVAEYICRIVLN